MRPSGFDQQPAVAQFAEQLGDVRVAKSLNGVHSTRTRQV
jgi:hypothetical protein